MWISLYNMRKLSTGYGVLEVLLVIALLGLFVIMGLSVWSRFRMRAQVHQIDTQVTTLLQALNAYFHAHCAKDWTFPFATVTVTLDQLSKDGLLPGSARFTNPWAQPYQMQIIGSARPIQFQVAANFNHLPGMVAKPEHFRRLLGAGGVGFKFIWTTTSQQLQSQRTATDLWPLNSHLSVFNLKLDKNHENNACFS